ncbi:MAG: ATP-dependent DNA helicase, partial [Elusimicrobiota bacterium]|nr:ATP-dependent DNA helicase [Elusimicrobiota bacterium]
DICRDSDLCMGKKCQLREECLHRKAIAKARQSQIIIVNQHLFFAGIPLNKFDAVIFDEAHNLEEVASHFLGFALTNNKIKRLLDDIFNQKTGRGVAMRLEGQSDIWRSSIKRAIAESHLAMRRFFHDISAKFDLDKLKAKTKRVKDPNFVEDSLSPKLQEVQSLLSSAVMRSKNEEEEKEIKAYMNRCIDFIEQLKVFLKCDNKNYAYWVEIARLKRGPLISLNRVPLDISGKLRKELFGREYSVVLTSATLAVDGSFDMAKSRLGLDAPREVLAGSPFDYKKQAILHIAHDMPNPEDDGEYIKASLKYLPKIVSAIDGGVFVLYTNWKFLYKSFDILKNTLKNRDIFKQGDTTPQQIIKEFKKSGNGVLLATDTFWQGIDVPGKALSGIIITRLPFLSPGTPLEEAKHEWMASRGMNVFNEYVLPKAVIKFRQGFGRLIRNKTDSGAVIILDPRIQTKRYGSKFLHSIPKCKTARNLNEIKDFFKVKGDSSN